MFDYSIFLGRNSFDLLANKEARQPLLKKMTAAHFRAFREALDLSNEITGQEALYVQGMKPHSGGTPSAVMSINLRTGEFLAILCEERKGKPFFFLWFDLRSTNLTWVSHEISVWLQERGAKLQTNDGRLTLINSNNPLNNGLNHLGH